ncbi:MAG: hypothetical protein ACTHM1_03520 [Solirubrobacteraceae bacterium]
MPLPKAARRAVAMACVAGAFSPLAVASGAARSAEQPSWEVASSAGYSATLEQCVTSSVAVQRSVTFTGQMVATPGTQRMSMRIELLERTPGQPGYRQVSAPGLGVWRSSEAGVRIYRYVKQITNLSAPAAYRAVVHFRWVGEKGHLLKRAELRTARCVQPSVSDTEGEAAASAAR